MSIKAELIDPGNLTPSQAEVARLMAEGLGNKDIARVLSISIKTVDVHASAIYEKLELRSRTINTRCTAIITLIARGMVSLSIKSIVAVLIFNAMQIDDPALRVKGGRMRVHVSRMRRNEV